MARPAVRRPASVVRDLHHALKPETDALGVLIATTQTLLRAVPADVWCGVLLDPSTLLDTGGLHESGFPEHVMPRMFEIEHAEQNDVDNLRALSRRPAPISVLSDSTRGDLGSSKYYREILHPLGLADELRLLLRDGKRVWGLLVWCRAANSPVFTKAERDLAAALSAPATIALRRSLLLSGVDDGQVPDAPGIMMYDDAQKEVHASPTAQRWLADLAENHSTPRSGRPYAVTAITTRVRSLEPGVVVQSRARTRSGKWVSLQAWRQHAGDATTAVSIGPAQPGELVAIVLDAYALSDREREITQHVLLGRSTHEIAQLLGVSGYTVQDHLKAVFDKSGVRSRRDLVADLFFRHYLPQLGHPTLSTDGRLRSACDY